MLSYPHQKYRQHLSRPTLGSHKKAPGSFPGASIFSTAVLVLYSTVPLGDKARGFPNELRISILSAVRLVGKGQALASASRATNTARIAFPFNRGLAVAVSAWEVPERSRCLVSTLAGALLPLFAGSPKRSCGRSGWFVLPRPQWRGN
jgi:hypothetical protein